MPSDEEASESHSGRRLAPEDEAQNLHLDIFDQRAQQIRQVPQINVAKSSVIERYSKRWLGVVVGGHLPTSKSQYRYFRALFKVIYKQPSVKEIWMPYPRTGIDVWNIGEDKHQSVLVDDVELVDSPKHVGIRITREVVPWSVIGLAFFDSFPDVGPSKRWIHGSTAEYTFIAEGRILDGKRGLIADGLPIKFDKLTGQVIQGAPKVMDTVPDDERPIGIYLGNPMYPKDVITGLDMWLEGNACHYGIKDGFHSVIKILQMGFCPPDLGLYARKVGH